MDPKRKRELELELELRKRKAAGPLPSGAEIAGGEGEDGEGDQPPTTAGETFYDSVQGGTRGVTLGFNDVVAGLGAAAGDLYQSTVDGRPRNPDAYTEGVQEERKRDAASQERSPRVFKRAELAGVLATAPLVAAKPVQLAARAASGAPVATTAVVNAAAPALTRYGRAAVAGALAKLGFDDVDTLAEVPAKAAGGATLGVGGEALGSLLSSGMATGVRGAADDVVAAAAEKLQGLQLRPAAREAAIDALDAIVKAGGPKAAVLKKVDDVVKGAAAKAVDKMRPAAPSPPAPPAPPVDNSFAEAMAQDAMARRLGGLVDEPMPTMPPRNPRTPADQIPAARNPRTPAGQIPKAPPADPLDELVAARVPAVTAPTAAASEPASTVIPVVTKNSSAGNIAQAVEATAVQLGTTDLATIANALKLPTSLVTDPLKNAVGRFAFREAVKASAGKAAPAADDVGVALQELAAEGKQAAGGMTDEAMSAINQARREVPRSLLPGDRPMAQVAGANQGAEMRAAYQALTPEQRVQWIQYLRGQGLTDEKIRTMLGVTQRDWRAQSFNR